MGIVSDIGGGSIGNGTRHSLARIPLRWMIRQCFILRTGILFHKTMFKDIGLDPDTLYPHVLSRPAPAPYHPDCLAHKYEDPINFAKNEGVTVMVKEPFINEEEEDMLDALTPIYDQLKLVKGWWFLELLPNKQRYQKEDDSWTHTLRYVKIILLSWIHLLILDDVVSTLVVPATYPSRVRSVWRSTGRLKFAWRPRSCLRTRIILLPRSGMWSPRGLIKHLFFFLVLGLACVLIGCPYFHWIRWCSMLSVLYWVFTRGCYPFVTRYIDKLGAYVSCNITHPFLPSRTMISGFWQRTIWDKWFSTPHLRHTSIFPQKIFWLLL